MRVCLFWNETAGEGVSLDELRSQITRAGHCVARVVERSEDLRDHLHHDFDVVAAAGGDGTIATAGRALAGGNIPLAILPRGTANNIATSLSLSGEVAELISRWSLDRVAHVDVGIVESPGTQTCFLESVGAGLVTDTIHIGRQTLAKGDPEAHLADARQLYIDILKRAEARKYSLRIGDQEIAGEYLLVEVLNTAFIGPGVKLTSDVSTADGLLSVVAVAETDRTALARYLKDSREDDAVTPPFNAWHVPGIDIRGVDRIHVDDRVERVEGSTVSVRVQLAALPILA